MSFNPESFSSWDELELELSRYKSSSLFRYLPSFFHDAIYDVSVAEINLLEERHEEMCEKTTQLRDEINDIITSKGIEQAQVRGEMLPDEVHASSDVITENKEEIEFILENKPHLITSSQQNKLTTVLREVEYVIEKIDFDNQVSQIKSWQDDIEANIQEFERSNDLISETELNDIHDTIDNIQLKISETQETVDFDVLSASDSEYLSNISTRLDEFEQRVNSHNEEIVGEEFSRLVSKYDELINNKDEILRADKTAVIEEHLCRIKEVLPEIDSLMSGDEKQFLTDDEIYKLEQIQSELSLQKSIIELKSQFVTNIDSIVEQTKSTSSKLQELIDANEYITSQQEATITTHHNTLTEKIEDITHDTKFTNLPLSNQYQAAAIDRHLQQIKTTLYSYKQSWLNTMKSKHGSTLNSKFESSNVTHTDNQFKAIFRNDNINRVNAAAGTGKTTVFGRRVYFLLTEFDDITEQDIIALTFSKNGVGEMEDELSEMFGEEINVDTLDIRTVNSYSREIALNNCSATYTVGEERKTDIQNITSQLKENHSSLFNAFQSEFYEEYDEEKHSQKVKNRTKSADTGLLGEEITVKDLPDEIIDAHNTIMEFLTRHKLLYTYQQHISWDDNEYTIDFKLPDTETYIEYCPSDAARRKLPPYKKPNYTDQGDLCLQFSEATDTSTRQDLITISGNNTDTGDSLQQRIKSELESELSEKTGLNISGRRITDDEAYYKYLHNTHEQTRKITDKLDDFITEMRQREWSTEKCRNHITSHIKSVENDDDIDIPDGVLAFWKLCIPAYTEYLNLYNKTNRIDHNEACIVTRELLSKNKVNNTHLYKHILVDEMQDLNAVQFGVVKQLRDSLPDTRTFGVGDDWQSIYGFQGARPNLFINYLDALSTGDVKHFTDTELKSNHRCPDTVVDASNSVIRNNHIQTEKNPTGRNTDTTIGLSKLSIGSNPSGYDRRTGMIEEIISLINTRQYEPEDTRILLRTKNANPVFYNSLRKRIREEVNPSGAGKVKITTAHNSKGSQSKHVIIPNVVNLDSTGFPLTKTDQWTEPVDIPPTEYQENEDTNYKMEEERRLFYVAMTRASEKLDIITIDGHQSRFISEIPGEHISTNT